MQAKVAIYAFTKQINAYETFSSDQPQIHRLGKR